MENIKKQFGAVRRLFIGIMAALMVAIGLYVLYVQRTILAKQPYRIAVLFPAGHAYAQEAYRGLCCGCTEHAGHPAYTTECFALAELADGASEKALEKVRQWHPDILVTIGIEATRAAQASTLHKPVVFVGVPFALEQGIIDDYTVPGHATTGVMEECVDPATMGALLVVFKPGAKKVCIPFPAWHDDDKLLTHRAVALKRFLQEHHIDATIIPFPDAAHFEKQLPLILAHYDVLLTLDVDPMPLSHAMLTSVCEATQTTFFAGSLDAVSAGAVFSFGCFPSYLGKQAFAQVRQVCEKGIDAGQVPIYLIEGHHQCIINAHAAEKQHLQAVHEPSVRLRLLRHLLSRQFVDRLMVRTCA